MRNERAHVLHGVDLQPVGKGGLARVVRRNEKPLYPRALRRDRHGQRARDASQLAHEGKLADEGAVIAGRVYIPRGGEYAYQHGQVVQRAGLLLVRGREVHGHAADGEFEAVILYRGAHALPRLLHGRVRQADDVEAGQPV